jgi:Protein of unknown function (DUF3891)
MLQREDQDGLIVISQPAHAWVSGQLARCWGNKNFGDVVPVEEVCLAAEQHDIGFLPWEQAPTLNQATGLPHTFLDLPTELHLHLWSTGIQQMTKFGRYPALLLSMHFSALCQRHPNFDCPAEAQMQQNFLDDQSGFQSAILSSLRNDFYYSVFSTEEVIRRNRQLISLWDWMSLLLCMGVREKRLLEDIPAAEGQTQLTLATARPESKQVQVVPWPFQGDRVRIVCEGRRLLKTFQNENVMREALKAASPVTINIELIPE